MTERPGKKIPSGTPDDLNEVLEAVDVTFRTGRVPEDMVTLSDEEAQDRLNVILSDLAATRQFIQALAQGDLSQELPVTGCTAGCLKALQANLRHLTWQTGQIASGDLSQRIHFMGEFSDSFNAMIEHLAEDMTTRMQREDELRHVNAALAEEIAERKKVEDALRMANRKITMLSSITRHDIRNQLLALHGYLGLSLQKATGPDILLFLEKGDRAAEAIGNQIEFTRFYENIGVNAPEWQEISLLVQSARSQLPALDRIEVINEIPPVTVYADSLIEKVFYNLLENTLRHGEHVSRIRISFHETDHGAEIVYEDNGVGISPEDKSHLFQKGFGKNTGLGLFLSQEILAITGLTMREDGEPGKGVRFVIAVPKDGYRLTGNS